MAKEMVVEESIVINRKRQDVYDFLRLLRNMEKFSKWNMMDPNQKTTHTGTDGTTGFIYSWDSKNKNVGAGSQEIKKMVEGELLETELRFERPMKNVGYSKFVLSDEGEGKTRVSWDFRGPTKFPFSLFIGAFQKRLGKDLHEGLENLRKHLEN